MNNVITYNVKNVKGSYLMTGIKPLTQDFYEYKGDNPMNFHKHVVSRINELKGCGYELVKVLHGKTLTGTRYFDLIVKKS